MAGLIRPGSDGPSRYLTVAEYNAVGPAYTPTLTGFTTSGTSLTATYALLAGNMVHVSVFGTIQGVSGAMIVSLPFPARRVGGYLGNAIAGDTGTGNHVGVTLLASTTTMWVIPAPSSGGVWGVGTPFAWATGDTFQMSLQYEKAA